MTIERATDKDVTGVHAIENACIACPWTKEQIADEMANGATDFFVARNESEEVVGYVNATAVIDEAEVGNIAVVESMRRRGVGKALMEKLLATLTARGVKRVFLCVDKKNISAIALYEKFGFAPMRERKRYYGDSDAWEMSKVL